MDTWRGNNHDPITLHKYVGMYADPVNVIDPSGNTGLFGFTVAQNINATLITASVAASGYNVFQIATGQKELTAREVGITALMLLSGPIAGKVVKTVGGKISAGASGSTLIAGTIKLNEALIKRSLAGVQRVTRQKSVSIPRIERYVEDMLKGDKFPPIKVDGNVIVDGHHRFIASKIAKVDLEEIPGVVPNFKKNDPVHDLINMTFSKMDF